MSERFLIPINLEGEVRYVDPVERKCRETGKVLLRVYRDRFDVVAEEMAKEKVIPLVRRSVADKILAVRHLPGQRTRGCVAV